MSRIRFQAKAHGLALLKGRWLKSAFILLIIGLLVLGFVELDNAYYSAFNIKMIDQAGHRIVSPQALIIESVFTVLLLFFLPPLLTGQAEWYWALSEGKPGSIGEVFGWFGSLKLYGKSLGLALNLFWRILLWILLTCLLPVAMLVTAYTFYYPGPNPSIATMDVNKLIFLLLTMFGYLLLLGGLFLLGYILMRYFLACFLMVEDTERKGTDAMRLSIRYSKGQRWEMWKFCLTYLPWFLTCYFVIPAFAVLPYFNASSTVLAKHMIYAGRAREKAEASRLNPSSVNPG